MIRIRGPEQARRIDDPAIRRLVEQRFVDICNGELYDPEIHGVMIVVVPGDTVEFLEQASGCCILHNLFDDARFGVPRVSMIERACRITQVNRPEHLIASHCKPWRDCESNDEHLDGENGLLLTPTVDHLFDRGSISFENNGDLPVSPVVHRESLKRMGIPPDERRNVGAFSEGQRRYLEYHRNLVFLEARVHRR